MPNIAFAQLNPQEIIKNQDKIELKKEDTKEILRSLTRNKLAEEWINSSILKEQVILVLLSKGIKIESLSYLLFDVNNKVLKSTLEIAYLILAKDPKLYIEKFEEVTVDKAKEYAMDWLSQKEIKIGKGNLKDLYRAYDGNTESITWPYILVYEPINSEQAKIVIEIYSSEQVKTPEPRGDYVFGYEWEGGIKEIPPFIVRIEGKVEKYGWISYKWTEKPKIDIIFDEPVPSFDFKEPSMWDDVKSSLDKLKNLAEDTFGDTVKAGISGVEVVVEGIKNFWDTIKTFVSDQNPLGASISNIIPNESEIISERNLKIIEEDIESLIQEPFSALEETIKEGVGGPKITEEEIQEILDDISERIDILSQKVAELVGESEGAGGPIEPIEPIEESEEEKTGEELVENEELENGKTAICFVEINTASKEELQKITGVGLATAQKIIEARPFSSINDLVRVSGIGEITLQKIIEQGCAYIEHYVGGGGGGGGGDVPSTYPKILISELQISSIEQRFIELYNPNAFQVNLTDWYIQRKTETGTSWNSLVTSTQFEGQTIQAKNYFLISRALEDSDILLTDLTLAESNSLVLKNPNREIVDLVGWGQAQDFETASVENPLTGQTLGRKWSETTSEYQDTNNNREDFEIQTPTPKAKNSQLFLSPPILKVFPESLEFSIIEFATPSQSQIFIITNNGDGSLEWDSIIEYTSPSDADWLKIEPDSGTAPSNISAFLTQDSSNLTEGDYSAKIIITAEGAEDSPQNVEVELSVKQSEEEEEEEEEEAPTLEVVINEIAWMGTKASSTDEWIELYNNSDQDINLFGWKLKSSDGGPDIIFGEIPETSILITTTISTQGFYLLERTDDDTIRDIPADWFGSFGNGLKNNPDCEILSLYNQNDNLIDRTVCLENGNWPAGDKDKKISMERYGDNWTNNNLIMRNGKDVDDNNIWGTPRAENSINPPTTINQLPFSEFDEITLGIESSPYIIANNLDVPEGKTLIIDPGVVLKFNHRERKITVKGTLKAIGTEDNKITFTCSREDPYPGCWGGVRFTETSVDSELNNTIFRYAGGSELTGKLAVQVDNASLIIQNSLFEYNMYNAVNLINSDSLINNVQFIENATHCPECHNVFISIGVLVSGGNPTIQNSLFEKNGYGIKIQDNSTALIKDNIFKENKYVAWLSSSPSFFIGNQAINNDFDGILTGGNINQDTTWSNNFPYILYVDINIPPDTTLTLNPGVVLKFNHERRRIIVSGTLKAIGTEDNKITFTCLREDPYPGCWGGVHFTETSVDSELNNTIFEYGGGKMSGSTTAVQVEDSLISINNSLFEHNLYRGVYLINSDSSINNSKFIENKTFCEGCHNEFISIGVNISGGSPTIQNSLFEKNGYGIKIRDGGDPSFANLTFGIGDEANVCNIYKENECINPLP